MDSYLNTTLHFQRKAEAKQRKHQHERQIVIWSDNVAQKSPERVKGASAGEGKSLFTTIIL